MTELYTNMRYLQYGTLQKLGLGHFDSWAASFGETQTAIELAPEGTGYRAKTRFAKFFNLPELIALFKECADIQTADMLNLPVPDAEYENVVLKPSEYQKDMVTSLADRAEAVRDRRVDAAVDNMLKITNDGRKLALEFYRAAQAVSQSVKIPGEKLSQVIYFYNTELQKAIRYVSPLNARQELAAVGEKEHEYGGQVNETEKKIITRTY